MTKKTAAPAPGAPETREQMEALVADICRDEIRHEEIRLTMERELHAVRDRHEGELTTLGERIKSNLSLAEDWALAHHEEFATRKSIVMVHGTVGYRTGMPRLKTLRGWTWDRVLNVLKVAFPEFVRKREEPAKDLILERRDDLGADKLRRIGLEVVQVESFYVEPHRDEKVAS